MMPLFRIASRVPKSSVSRVFVGTQASTQAGQSVLPENYDETESVKAFETVWNRHRSIVEGVQGEEPQYSVNEARRVMSIATEFQTEGPCVQGIQENYSMSGLADSGSNHLSTEDVHSPVYNGMNSHVNLHGCMQSNVPKSLSTSPVSGYSSHMGMPGGGQRQLDKYASSALQFYHPSRHFSTSASRKGMEGVQEMSHDQDVLLADPSPQGIQGDNCVSFKLWMENCQRYNLPNCDEQMESIKAGRKTLAQVFFEQQEIIRRVADDYKKQQVRRKQISVNAQGLQDCVYNFEFSLSEPCPQGLQGDDCANYKFWAFNCQAFGFGDCSEKLNDMKTGRRNLHEVFAEQDKLIRQIVKEYRQKRSYSTDTSKSSAAASSEVGNSDTSSNSNSSQSTPPNDNQDENLSQKDKLKRAVKEYGGTVIVFHIGISLISLGGFYLAVSSGLDVVGLLSKMGVGEAILQSKLATGSTTFVMAYAVHKVFAPVRIGITLTCTPLIVRHLRKIGMLKPPKRS